MPPIRRRTSNTEEFLPRVVALPAAGLVALAVAAAAYAHEGHAPLPTKGATVQGDRVMLSDKARRAIGVEVTKITLGDLRRVVRAVARVELPWHQQAMVTTLVPGRITRVLIRPGEAVEEGQELAWLDSLELESLQRELLKADAERAHARRLFDLRESLHRANVVALADLLDARRSLEEQSARLVIAEQKLLALGLDREAQRRLRTTGRPLLSLAIVSPIRGVVTHADVRVGQQVEPTQHLYHVVNTSEVGIAGEVLESDVAAVAVGQQVRVRFSALPGRVIAGALHHIHPGIDPRIRVQEAVIHVPNPDGALRPGLSGVMEIEVARAREAIVCPALALLDERSGPHVLRSRGAGTFERRRVRVGLRDGDRVEILDGLFPGDQVVTSGKNLLASLLAHTSPTPGRIVQVAGPVDRVDSATPLATKGQVVVAQASVELPTDRKRFAGSRVEGRIARMFVDPGQAVREGQVLAEVESLPLRNLQLDFLRAHAVRAWTQQAVERFRGLAEKDAVARKDLWRYEAELKVLDQTVASLRAKLLEAGLNDEILERLQRADLTAQSTEPIVAPTVPVRAPSAGRLADFQAVPGQVVRPADALFQILDTSRVWVKAYVFERQAPMVRAGQAVTVSFPAMPDRSLSGVVVRVSPTLEETERVLPVWVEVANPDGKLVEGMMARVVIAVGPQGVPAVTDRTTAGEPLVAASGRGRAKAPEQPR